MLETNHEIKIFAELFKLIFRFSQGKVLVFKTHNNHYNHCANNSTLNLNFVNLLLLENNNLNQ